MAIIEKEVTRIMFNRIFSCPWAKRCAYLTAILSLIAISTSQAQVIQAPYDADYTLTDLGQVPGVPSFYGGIAFLHSDSNTMLIGGDANDTNGKLYAIQVTRDAGDHITGFTGVATVYADAPFNDGGLAYGPGNVLFYARYSPDPGEIGQIKPGSVITDKVNILDSLSPTYVPYPGGLNFPPPGYPGAGKLKIADYGGGDWYSADIAADGAGTFNIVNMVRVLNFASGPEGFVYVPVGSPQFPNFSILLSDYDSNEVVTYQVDANGDPIAASRTLFVSDLSGAEGAVIDPVTGDFLFSTYGGGDRVIAVQGFTPPAPTYTVGGTVSGLTGTGLALQNNGGDTLPVAAAATAFTFATELEVGFSYVVNVSTQPTGQTCTVSNGSGTISDANITDVAVTCTDNPGPDFTINGAVSGLGPNVVTLQNNGADDLDVDANGVFVFATALPDGSTYDVTVLTQPTGQTCDVTNGVGTINGSDVLGVDVECLDDVVAPPTASVPIPTLSEWALILLTMFIGLMVFANRRRLF
jgi:hypothetical protein